MKATESGKSKPIGLGFGLAGLKRENWGKLHKQEQNLVSASSSNNIKERSGLFA